MKRTRERIVSRAFVMLMLHNGTFFAAGSMLTPVLGRFVKGPLHGGTSGVGLAFGAYAVGAMAVRPLAGRLGDRIGRRPTGVAGAAIFGVAVMLYGLAEGTGGTWWVVGVRILSGGAGAAVYVGATAAATDMAPPARRGEAISVFSVSVFLGVALGPLVGEALYQSAGYGVVWIVCGVTGLASAALGLVVPETNPPQRLLPAGPGSGSGSGAGRAPRQPFFHPAAIRPGIVICLGAVGLSSFNTFLAVYGDSIGMRDVAPVLLVFAVVTVCSRLFGAKLNDTMPRRTMATISLVSAAVSLYTMALWQETVGIYVAAVFLALGMSYMYPTFVLIGVDAAPDSEKGAVVGTLTAFTDVSNAIGGLVLGVFASWTSYRGAFGLAGGLITIALVLLFAGVALPRPGQQTVSVTASAPATGERVL